MLGRLIDLAAGLLRRPHPPERVRARMLEGVFPGSMEFLPFDWRSGSFRVFDEGLAWRGRDGEEWVWDVEQAYWMPSE